MRYFGHARLPRVWRGTEGNMACKRLYSIAEGTHILLQARRAMGSFLIPWGKRPRRIFCLFRGMLGCVYGNLVLTNSFASGNLLIDSVEEEQ